MDWLMTMHGYFICMSIAQVMMLGMIWFSVNRLWTIMHEFFLVGEKLSRLRPMAEHVPDQYATGGAGQSWPTRTQPDPRG